MTWHEGCLVGRPRMLTRALALLGALALASAPRLAHADDDTKMLARRHFDRGMELARKGAYAEALVEFTRAHQTTPHYAVLYNIGQAHVELGHPVEAVDVFTRYLAEAGDQIDGARRSEVDAEIARQRMRIAEVVLSTDPPGALISVDGREMGRTPLSALRVSAGTHLFTAAIEGRRTIELRLTLAGGEQRRLELSLPTLTVEGSTPMVAIRPVQVSPKVSRESSSPVQATLGYVAVAVGAGLGGAALAHYVWNKGRYDTWRTRHRELAGAEDRPDYDGRQQRNNELSESIGRASAVTAGLGIGAGVVFGTGVVLVVAAPASSSHGSAAKASLVWNGVF
jgi:hypothetical protein